MKDEHFEAIMKGMEETLAWAGGEDRHGLRIHFPPDADVRTIRENTGLTQTAFAEQIGIPVATLRNWEHGRRCPVGPARVLLAMLAKDPKIVTRTLAKDP